MLAYMVVGTARTLAETKNGIDLRVFYGIAKIIHNEKMWCDMSRSWSFY